MLYFDYKLHLLSDVVPHIILQKIHVTNQMTYPTYFNTFTFNLTTLLLEF